MNRMYLIAFAAVIALAGAAFWAFNTVLEFEKPSVVLKGDVSTIGQSSALGLTVADRKSGIRSVSVTISQDGMTIGEPFVGTQGILGRVLTSG